METIWKFSRLGVLFTVLVSYSLCLCSSLNDEGLALLRLKERVVSDPFGALTNWRNSDTENSPCSWFRVECSDDKVVILNLKDLCLEGTLTPEIRSLTHIKSIILCNNSFTGIIPEGFGELKELEVLDLRYNNFSGPLPNDLGINDSLAILNNVHHEDATKRRLLQDKVPPARLNDTTSTPTSSSMPSPSAPIPPASAVPTNDTEGTTATPNVSISPPTPSISPPTPSVSPPTPSPPQSPPKSRRRSSKHLSILFGIIGGTIFLIAIICMYLYRSNKVSTVKPWATGLSGQLQKAFVTGVPKLKRSELDAACEDFSNVIGSSPIGMVYKGTLSSGEEIAVASVAVASARDWSKNLEMHFRNKIDTLSKVNHKNFVNLIGYCEEEVPFTRMMVFEYAPNGTLFEHLHIRESEHLDWGMRLRIAMGMAYCLEHMHRLNPPIAHNYLNSSAIYLTEDYAAKLSDFTFWNERAAVEMELTSKKLLNVPSSSPEGNIYSFGVLLFEMITGRLPYLMENGSFEDWVSDYLSGKQPLQQTVDPTLSSFDGEQLEKFGEVIKLCVHRDPEQRPTMREVTRRLREITGITPDGAIPKLSPLWWAELEILSTDAM